MQQPLSSVSVNAIHCLCCCHCGSSLLTTAFKGVFVTAQGVGELEAKAEDMADPTDVLTRPSGVPRVLQGGTRGYYRGYLGEPANAEDVPDPTDVLTRPSLGLSDREHWRSGCTQCWPYW
jgi:hypothetical protein